MNEKDGGKTAGFTSEWGLYVAGQTLWFQAADPSRVALEPPGQNGFTVYKGAEDQLSPAFSHHINLTVEDEIWQADREWGTAIHRNQVWELWQDDDANLVLLNPSQPVKRRVVIHPGFTSGKVYGAFSEKQHGRHVALPEELQIVLFVNWLANSGDIILHACGIRFGDKGYAFLGDSGAGKSTLAGRLAQAPDIRVLGEDQVVLRCIAGEFWIFGTPWHFNQGLCSPEGARLERLFFIEKTGTEGVQTLAPLEGVKKILQTAFIPYYRTQTLEGILSQLEVLSRAVVFNSFSFTLESRVQDLVARQ